MFAILKKLVLIYSDAPKNDVKQHSQLMEGRAMKSPNIFQLPQFNTRPVNNKNGRFIIYPSFNPNFVHQTQQKNYRTQMSKPIGRIFIF